ncbi:DUF6980 family protein [Aurantivibrio infirmus]
MKKHCCREMNKNLTLDCDTHDNVFECPDVLINFIPKFDEYGLIIHDGGSSVISISYCPWCSTKLPESKRDMWFNKLNGLGFTDPDEQDIPKEFTSEAWYEST